MSKDFEKLTSLIQKKTLYIVVNDLYATDFFFKNSKIGKVLSWISKIMPAFILALLFGIHGYAFVVGIIFVAIYALTLKQVSQIFARKELLKDENTFLKDYEAKNVRIFLKSSKKKFNYPEELADFKDRISLER